MTESRGDSSNRIAPIPIAQGWPIPAPHRFVGASTRIVLERRVPGEIDESDFAELIAEIQHATGDQGVTTVLGRSLTWQFVSAASFGKPGGVPRWSVIIRPEKGHTWIRIEEPLSALATGIFGGAVGGVGGWGMMVGVGALVLKGTYFLLGVGAATLGLSYLAGRAIFHTVEKHKRRAHERLMDRLELLIRGLEQDRA
jgi:hypothetical protein